MAQDPYSRCGHGDGGHGLITLTGELTTNANIDAVQIAAHGEQYQVNTNIVQQSSDFRVDVGGAGDQGMVGYACDSNEEFVKQELYLARNLNKLIFAKFPNDGKTQITLRDGKSVVWWPVFIKQNLPNSAI